MPLSPPITLPNTFVNGTVADANQVNANFSALLAAINSGTRVGLTATTNFYVSGAGVDVVGNGLSPATPAATVNFILNLLQENYDLSTLPLGAGVIILVAAGSYSQTITISGMLFGQLTASQLVIQPLSGSVTFDGDPTFNVTEGARCLLNGLTIQSSFSSCVISQRGSEVRFTGCTFGNAVFAHLLASRAGLIQSVGDYTIAAGATDHLHADNGYIFIQSNPANYLPPPMGVPTVTLTGTPAFSSAFARAKRVGLINVLATFSGSATGPRYNANAGGIIDTQGQGTTYLPGNVAGTADGSTGGYYL